LVDSSGVQKPIEVNLMLGTDPVAARLGALIQSEVAKVGFKVTLAATEFVTSLSRADAGNFQTFAIGWSGRVDADGNVYQFVHSKGSQNDSGYVDSLVDLTLDNARKAATLQARLASYRAFMKRALRDLPLIYLYHPVNRFGTSKSVGGVQVFGDGLIRAALAYYK
jgi:peptide/nickel transport system substrate-binding protein